MKPIAIFLIGLLSVTSSALAQEDVSPHRMVGADGQLDMSMCGICHTETFELARPKGEVCTLCHATTTHAGASEHLQARPQQVAQLSAAKEGEEPRLPLTEDGHIYCGTCHLFHDPSMGEDKPLASAWVASKTGLAGAVASSVAGRANLVAHKHGVAQAPVKFSSKGTTALRLSVDDGKLCIRCHGSLTQ